MSLKKYRQSSALDDYKVLSVGPRFTFVSSAATSNSPPQAYTQSYYDLDTFADYTSYHTSFLVNMLFSSIIRYGAALATLAVTANCAAIPTYDVETREITKRDMTAKDIVNAIEGVTIMSQNLQPFANQISIVNAPLFLVGLGPVPVSPIDEV